MVVRARKLSRFYDEHLWSDWAVGLAGLLILTMDFPGESASNFHSGVAAVAGVVLGMASIVMAIYSQAGGRRMTAARQQIENMHVTWVSIMRGILASCFLALLALAIGGSYPNLALVLSAVGATVMLLRTLRMINFLGLFMRIQSLDAAEGKAVTINPQIGVDA